MNRNIFNSDLNLFLGYTHTSWWQIYNTGWSRQFRETNYTPSVFVRKIFERPKKISRFNILAYDIGYIHQSNGQIQELSRSWDRLFFRTAFGVNRFVFVINTWIRLKILDRKLDDNPNILDYRGYGDLKIKYYDGKSIYSLKIIPGLKYYGSEVGYSYPINEGVRFYTKINYGYGHSLIDNENKEKRIGIGFALSDFLSMN